MSPMEALKCDAAICVIGNLDADGRLSATNEEIAQMGGWTEDSSKKAAGLDAFDPVWMWSARCQECLLVQLEVRGEAIVWPRG